MPAYDRTFNPPAPVADVTVANPVRRNKRSSLRGKMDTGADITVIPERHHAGTSNLHLGSPYRMNSYRAILVPSSDFDFVKPDQGHAQSTQIFRYDARGRFFARIALDFLRHPVNSNRYAPPYGCRSGVNVR